MGTPAAADEQQPSRGSEWVLSADQGAGHGVQHPLQLHPSAASSEQVLIMKSPHVRPRHELEHWTGAEGGEAGGGGGGGGAGGMQQPKQWQPNDAVMTSQFRSW